MYEFFSDNDIEIERFVNYTCVSTPVIFFLATVKLKMQLTVLQNESKRTERI